FKDQPSPTASACPAVNDFRFAANNSIVCRPIIGVAVDPVTGFPLTDGNGAAIPQYGPPRTVSGFRLQDGRASYGIGLETFALGFPIHFDWSWRTLFNRDWEDIVYAADGGTSKFRRARFAVWIGYDF